MVTKFGKFCRKLRIERDEILRDMAKVFNVTVSYLSAVENGVRAIPTGWKEILIDAYNLTVNEIKELEMAIIDTNEEIKIKLRKGDEQKQEFALKLARKFDTLTEEEIDKISKILQGGM